MRKRKLYLFRYIIAFNAGFIANHVLESLLFTLDLFLQRFGDAVAIDSAGRWISAHFSRYLFSLQ